MRKITLSKYTEFLPQWTRAPMLHSDTKKGQDFVALDLPNPADSQRNSAQLDTRLSNQRKCMGYSCGKTSLNKVT